MAAFFGSAAKAAVRRPDGQIGYTSKRRHDALTAMGYNLDSRGFITDGTSGGGGASGSNQSMNAFKQMLPQTLNNPAMFARPEAAAMLAGQFGQQTPAWAQAPQQAPANNPWGNVQQGYNNPFYVVGGKLPFPNMQQGTPMSPEAIASYRAEQDRLMQDPAYRDLMNMTVDNDMGMSRQPGYQPPSYGSYSGPGSTFQNPFMSVMSEAFRGLLGGGGGGTPGPAPSLQNIMQRYKGLLGNGGGAMMPNEMRAF